MHRAPVGSHGLGDGVRIKDRPSSSFPFPFVRVARCRICVPFQGSIWPQCSDALQSFEHLGAQVRKTAHLI